MKKTALLLTLALTLSTVMAPAGTIKVPKDEPAVTLTIPDNWEPEEDDAGVLAESPDNVATVYFEVVGSEDELKEAIEGSVEWLAEHEVKVDESTQEEKEFKTGEREWKVISWTANHKEWGEASVGFLFTDAGDGNVLTVTYWISKKDSEKSLATLEKIFSSVKTVK
jgi:FAD/FMN-containing dehydrogenase